MERKAPLFLLAVALLCAISFSCTRHASKFESPAAVFYPAPPDSVRMQFLVSYGSSEDFTGTPSRFRAFVAGKPEPLDIKKPYGLATDKGKLYIADPGSKSVLIADMDKNSFEPFLPSGRGSLKLPVNCNTDHEGRLYVADVERKQVVIFDPELRYVAEISGEENFKPTDVFIQGDTVFVTDPNNNRINAYDRSSGEPLFSIPEGAEVGGENWLYNPMNLYVREGKIYVTDFGHANIKIFDLNGRFLASVGGYGRALGQFARPKGIAVDRNLNLYVVDASFQNVQIFNPEGQLLMFFGGPYAGPGDLYLPANVCIDYDNIDYYKKFVDPAYELTYLIFVSSQYGPDKVNVYGRIVPK